MPSCSSTLVLNACLMPRGFVKHRQLPRIPLMNAKRLQEGPSQMKCRSKSRAGCRSCKMKRLKCDEAVPACRNCMARGIACPGYQKHLKWSTKYETRRASVVAPLEFDELASAASKSIRPVDNGPPTPISAIRMATDIGRSPSRPKANASTKHEAVDMDPPGARNARDKRSVHRPSRQRLFTPNPSQTLTQPSTKLVELWFKSVCGVWSAFDSPSNPFRCLCSSLWTSSEVVFYSLQSMAGTSQPSATMDSPTVREAATLAPRLANQALIRELQALFEAPSNVSAVPSGLLISLFCMSSSCSWVDSRELGLQYLGNARLVLDLVELNLHSLQSEDRKLLDFFRGCLVYEQMLRGIVSDREEDVSVLLEWNIVDSASDPFALHAWTGVSTTVVMLLGKSMALCRKSRHLWRQQPVATYKVMFQTLLDIEQGQRLEETLLSIDVSAHLQGAATDASSIRLHLYHATEAFRLSALLQLYQSFPDLLSRRLPSEDIDHQQSAFISGLAIRIGGLLATIPATSSMRCLQPLLCICAGSGLRHAQPVLDRGAQRVPRITDGQDQKGPAEMENLCMQSDVEADIIRTRAFFLSRLTELDQGILSNSAITAKKLMALMWSAFDRDEAPQKTHWMDIMASSRAWTVFG